MVLDSDEVLSIDPVLQYSPFVALRLPSPDIFSKCYSTKCGYVHRRRRHHRRRFRKPIQQQLGSSGGSLFPPAGSLISVHGVQ